MTKFKYAAGTFFGNLRITDSILKEIQLEKILNRGFGSNLKQIYFRIYYLESNLKYPIGTK